MSSLRSLISTLFLGVLLAAIYWIGYLPSQAKQDALRTEILSLNTDITALQARVAGLAGSRPEHVFPKELMWKATNKEDAELALQDAIVTLTAQFGITLITFGTSSLTRDTVQDMMAFEVEAAGSLGDIHAFIAALETLDPKTVIGMLRMRPVQGYGIDNFEDVSVYSQITFWAFWGEAT